ncbi:hypothetical protein [Candidatus Uabimicrobium amorphum]|uniref:Uncharacterized protein n=1 Tax=Uabimicrobium amorphum TaxID=2596890 RepID=A0A5S9F6Q1_UABAM|nr:hypothetical protein [Candidatus Uabimicrobium amorphum]BBM88116.1 hypothetical protein UABAM_06532 [Candidatus Uabimicrobium amorphum]
MHNRDPQNLQSLEKALDELNTSYRTRRGIVIKPDVSGLASSGHHLLTTDEGLLDLLGTFGNGQDYNDLLPNSHLMQIGEIQVRVQSLQSLIELKKEIGREKDKAVLPILIQTLKEHKND